VPARVSPLFKQTRFPRPSINGFKRPTLNHPRNRHQDDDEPKKRFHIQRRRLGTVKFVQEKGDFGFIEAEDFREDVFFHHSVWEDTSGRALQLPVSKSPTGPRIHKPRLSQSIVNLFVEFELDDELFVTEKKLRAKIVRVTSRPEGRKLKASDATFIMPRHHPKARKKRPDWRG